MPGSNSSTSDRPGFTERMRGHFNVVALAVSVFTTFAEVTFFRTNLGERYFQGWKIVLVIPLLIVFPIFWPGYSPAPVHICLLLYMLTSAKHRVNIFRRRRRGERGVHSLYNGTSRLAQRFPKVPVAILKSRHEPVVMFAMGLCALVWSPPLAWLFIWTSAAMAAHAGLLNAHHRQRALDLADAQIDGELLSGTSREHAFSAASPVTSVARIHRSQS